MTAHAVFLVKVSVAFHASFFLQGSFPLICKNTCYPYFICFITFKSLQPLRFFSRLHCQTTNIEKPHLYRYKKNACENCGTQTTKLNLARRKRFCSAGTLYYTQYPNFSTKSQDYLKYHITKKHSAPKPDVTFECKLCYQTISRFYALRQHRNTQHGMQIGSGTRDVDVENLLWEMLRITCWEKSCVPVNISWWIRNLKEQDTKYATMLWKFSSKQSWTRNLIIFVKNLNRAAKVNLAFGFILKNIADGGFGCF